jgi:hypothetical protein
VIERFGQAALDAQLAFLQRMPAVQFTYGDNGAVSEVRGRTGIFLPSGLATFKVNEPAKELLEKIGPALLASGTEELHVFNVHRDAPKARPDSPERTVRLDQYIRGREVQGAAVLITLDIQTNEITGIETNFLPDRGLQHEPALTAAQARAKVEAAMRDSGLEEERKVIFEDSPARLAYAFEDFIDGRSIGGVLVWVFQATRFGESVDVVVNALTGEVIRVRTFVTGLYLKNRLSYTAGGEWPGPPYHPGQTACYSRLAKEALRLIRSSQICTTQPEQHSTCLHKSLIATHGITQERHSSWSRTTSRSNTPSHGPRMASSSSTKFSRSMPATSMLLPTSLHTESAKQMEGCLSTMWHRMAHGR